MSCIAHRSAMRELALYKYSIVITKLEFIIFLHVQNSLAWATWYNVLQRGNNVVQLTIKSSEVQNVNKTHVVLRFCYVVICYDTLWYATGTLCCEAH